MTLSYKSIPGNKSLNKALNNGISSATNLGIFYSTIEFINKIVSCVNSSYSYSLSFYSFTDSPPFYLLIYPADVKTDFIALIPKS